MTKAQRWSLYIQSAFYLLAGLHHFVNPGFYLPIMPDYFKAKMTINYMSGGLEMMFGACLLTQNWRDTGAWGLFYLLITFIPVHIWFIAKGSCVPDGLCVPPWVGWVRLVLVHPLLMWWAWSASVHDLDAE